MSAMDTRRVLVVEDDDAIRSLLHLALATEGYEVRTALDALQPPLNAWR